MSDATDEGQMYAEKCKKGKFLATFDANTGGYCIFVGAFEPLMQRFVPKRCISGAKGVRGGRRPPTRAGLGLLQRGQLVDATEMPEPRDPGRDSQHDAERRHSSEHHRRHRTEQPRRDSRLERAKLVR